MHALTVLVAAASVDAVSDLLSEQHAALSVSIEDADAGSAAERPVFDEPGTGDGARWQRARLTALFGDEAGATGAAQRPVQRRGRGDGGGGRAGGEPVRPGRADRSDRAGRRPRLGPP
ncbi:MAG TPA: hypothetical protein VF308_10435, partial [Caldimonas sp.]